MCANGSYCKQGSCICPTECPNKNQYEPICGSDGHTVSSKKFVSHKYRCYVLYTAFIRWHHKTFFHENTFQYFNKCLMKQQTCPDNEDASQRRGKVERFGSSGRISNGGVNKQNRRQKRKMVEVIMPNYV